MKAERDLDQMPVLMVACRLLVSSHSRLAHHSLIFMGTTFSWRVHAARVSKCHSAVAFHGSCCASHLHPSHKCQSPWRHVSDSIGSRTASKFVDLSPSKCKGWKFLNICLAYTVFSFTSFCLLGTSLYWFVLWQSILKPTLAFCMSKADHELLILLPSLPRAGMDSQARAAVLF